MCALNEPDIRAVFNDVGLTALSVSSTELSIIRFIFFPCSLDSIMSISPHSSSSSLRICPSTVDPFPIEGRSCFVFPFVMTGSLTSGGSLWLQLNQIWERGGREGMRHGQPGNSGVKSSLPPTPRCLHFPFLRKLDLCFPPPPPPCNVCFLSNLKPLKFEDSLAHLSPNP